MNMQERHEDRPHVLIMGEDDDTNNTIISLKASTIITPKNDIKTKFASGKFGETHIVVDYFLPNYLKLLDYKVARILQGESKNIKYKTLERLHFIARLLILVLTRRLQF